MQPHESGIPLFIKLYFCQMVNPTGPDLDQIFPFCLLLERDGESNVFPVLNENVLWKEGHSLEQQFF